MSRTIGTIIGLVLALGFGGWCGYRCGVEETQPVDPRNSVFFMPWDNLVNTNPDAKAAAAHLLNWMKTKDPEDLQAAKSGFKTLEITENFGGEYGSLAWFSSYLGANEAGRKSMRRDPIAARLVRYFRTKNWTPLKNYLELKYGFR